MRKKIVLACSECGSRNYSTMSKKDTERLELKKYCNQCNLILFIGKQNSLGYDKLETLHVWRLQKCKRIGNFFREVGREMRKVSWPKRKELTSYTVTVLSTVVFFALFFAVIDLGISNLIRFILE